MQEVSVRRQVALPSGEGNNMNPKLLSIFLILVFAINGFSQIVPDSIHNSILKKYPGLIKSQLKVEKQDVGNAYYRIIFKYNLNKYKLYYSKENRLLEEMVVYNMNNFPPVLLNDLRKRVKNFKVTEYKSSRYYDEEFQSWHCKNCYFVDLTFDGGSYSLQYDSTLKFTSKVLICHVSQKKEEESSEKNNVVLNSSSESQEIKFNWYKGSISSFEGYLRECTAINDSIYQKYNGEKFHVYLTIDATGNVKGIFIWGFPEWSIREKVNYCLCKINDWKILDNEGQVEPIQKEITIKVTTTGLILEE